MKRAMAAGARSSWFVYPLLLLVTMVAWAISSPAGSSPDEDFHLVNAWCALGPRAGYCEPGSTSLTRVVPADVVNVACFAFKPTAPGNCTSSPGLTVETDRWNYSQLYPEGFYVVMGAFVGPSVSWSVLAMRTFNALLYALGIAALLFLADPKRRANYLLASLVTMVPLGLFIVASVNPSGWAVTSATLVWPSAVEFFRSTERWRRIGLGLLCGFGMAMAFASRSDAAAYAGLAIGLAWIATARASRRSFIYGGIAGGIILFALLWSQSLGSASLFAIPASVSPASAADGLLGRIMDLPAFYAGAFGTRELGWVDTAMPWITWILAGSAFAMTMFWGLRRCGRRKAASLLVVLAVGSAVPVLIATARQFELSKLQPRYFLPLVIIGAMIAVSEDNPDGPELNLVQALTIPVALGLAQAAALHANLRRYVTGVDVKAFNLDAGVEWWWNWAPSPMVVLAVGATAFLGAVAVVALASHSQPEVPMVRLSA